LGVFCLTADKIAQIFGVRKHKRLRGKLHHSEHVLVIGPSELSPQAYTLNQLRYDLRKMKGHGLLERVGKHYAYRLTWNTCGCSIHPLPQARLRAPGQ
jgi:hypothetical protein